VPRINYTVEQLREKAVDLRRDIIAMHATGRWGAVGSPLAAADLMATLFFYEVNFDRDDPAWPERDIWHVSSASLSTALYAAMAEVGLLATGDLLRGDDVESLAHHLQPFPSSGTPRVEATGGVPGAGLSVSIGMAMASRLDGAHRRVYCVMDDSEVQNGLFWEGAIAAAHHELHELVLVIDYDGKQAGGDVEEVLGYAPLTEKLRSFNWHTIEIDGNDLDAVVGAFDRSRTLKGAPVAILSCTALGKGVSFMEDDEQWCLAHPDAEQAAAAMTELGTTMEEWSKRLSA
jgi:transketolase